MQKKMLQALTRSGDSFFSSNYIVNNRLVAASSVQKAIIALQEDGLVEKEQSSYFISDPFFQEYLKVEISYMA